MSNTSSKNQIALAENKTKLKHWTQAIRDLYGEFLELKSGIVPEKHSSPTDQYGIGTTFEFGHLRLLDTLLYNFKKDEENPNTYWICSNIKCVDTPDIPNVDSESQNKNYYKKYKWNAVTWHEDGLFVAVGSHGRIVTSLDGKTWDDVHWQSSNSETSEDLAFRTSEDFEYFDVKWCGDMFVAVGSYNSFTYSYDGAYWHTPTYVGSFYEVKTDNSLVYHVRNVNDDLSVVQEKATAKDAWKGIAYDENTGFIILCGTQDRTLVCQHVATETTSKINFANETVFHQSSISTSIDHTLNSIASMKLPKSGNTVFVACGNYNEIVQGIVPRTAISIEDDVQWNNIIVVEDDVHKINPPVGSVYEPISSTTGWNNISVRHNNADGNDYFVTIGTEGQAVISINGVGYTWEVSNYDYRESIKTNFQCQAQGWNLAVIAGNWTSASEPNIVMYNDSEYIDPKDITYGSTIPKERHFLTMVDKAFWYGAAFGRNVFVLVGSGNRIYYHEIVEGDTRGAALSVDFYRRYIMDLQKRIQDLENRIVSNNLVFMTLGGEGNPSSRTFSWMDSSAYLFKTKGNISLNFIKAPQYIYREIMIYLEAEEETELTLSGAGEWENDLDKPVWGAAGSHLAMKVIFVGNRVIVQIIDNDQLADNLAALDG